MGDYQPSSALDRFVAPGLRLWMLLILLLFVLTVMVVIVCCFIRIRIPRTKRQIELIAARRRMRKQRSASNAQQQGQQGAEQPEDNPKGQTIVLNSLGNRNEPRPKKQPDHQPLVSKSIPIDMLTKWIIFSLFSYVVAQNSFANTKFDLPADLPIEDLIAISENRDVKPKQVTSPHKNRKIEKETKVVVPSTPAPPTVVPVVFTTMTFPTFSFPTMPSLAPFAFSTPAPLASSPIPPLSLLPQTPLPAVPAFPPAVPPQVAPQVPQFPQIPQAPQAPQVAPQVPQASQVPQAPVQILSAAAPRATSFIPSQGNRQIELIPANQHRDRVELWFKEDFDFKKCASNPENVAEQFLEKFPKNLLKNNKEAVLAQLLSSRLKECLEKQNKNTWNNINDRLGGLNLSTSEENECRSGLIQEQISCLNVQSYACQFIQPSYNFRLVPTRIIIQEARFAEDGAEKCRKAKKLIKKQQNN
ncbi:hypothetical protein FO519_008666 [Halicephalobus sp. NKZ332]|nr:hypothetical protein FO519_008666 [Halicephalobus sp. NKZ332]